MYMNGIHTHRYTHTHIHSFGGGFDHISHVSSSLRKVIIRAFFLFIEFIGMTLVNKIIQVSGTQFHNTSSVSYY